LVHPPHPHAPSTVRSSISLSLPLISPPRSSFTHTPHTHTRSTLHPPSRRYLFKPRSHLTSPHLTSHPPRRTRLCCFLNSTQPHQTAFLLPLGSHLETRHDASCPSTLYRHLALSVPLNNTNSRYIDIVVSLVLSTDII
jgi:hypothetical protein